MPILPQPAPPPQRRHPWLGVLLGVPGAVLLLLVGLVAWSWDHPVQIRMGRRFVAIDHHRPIALNGGGGVIRAFLRRRTAWVNVIPLPPACGSGSYEVILDLE